MSKIFNKVQLKLVLRVLDVARVKDPVKYKGVCDILDNAVVKWSFDGNHHTLDNQRCDSAPLCSGVNDRGDTAASCNVVSDLSDEVVE